MIGCVLRATGKTLDIDAIKSRISLTPNNFFRKGDAKSRNREWETSGLTFVVSDAPGNDLSQQISDAVEFLSRNKEDLTKLRDFMGLEDLRLEFSVDKKKGFRQDTFFPAGLVKSAGDLAIGIELLIYG